MEAIEPGKPAVDYWNCFGRQLAEHHRRGQGRAFGWSSDNYIGRPFKRTSRAIIGWSFLASVVLDIS